MIDTRRSPMLGGDETTGNEPALGGDRRQTITYSQLEVDEVDGMVWHYGKALGRAREIKSEFVPIDFIIGGYLDWAPNLWKITIDGESGTVAVQCTNLIWRG